MNVYNGTIMVGYRKVRLHQICARDTIHLLEVIRQRGEDGRPEMKWSKIWQVRVEVVGFAWQTNNGWRLMV